MDRTLTSAIIGLILLVSIVIATSLLPAPLISAPFPLVTVSPTPRITPVPFSPTPAPSRSISTLAPVQGRIDSVDTTTLALGRISYAYVTLTNTGTVPITKILIDVTAGRDFGFPLGYQTQRMIHEIPANIAPGETRTLADQFDLPLYEGIIPLEGLYSVTMDIYANDGYFLGEWSGEVYLKG